MESRSLDHIIDDSQEESVDTAVVNEEPIDDDETGDYNPVKDWITDIRSSAESPTDQGRTEINACYAKEFIDRFMTDAYEFPLWSGACLPSPLGQKHATTSYSEGYFNDKKHRVMRRFQGRPRCDLFLKMEHEDYNGSAAAFQDRLVIDRAQQFTKSKAEDESSVPFAPEPVVPESSQPSSPDSCDSEPEKEPMFDSDTVSTDNWRNKARKPADDRRTTLLDSTHDDSTEFEPVKSPKIREKKPV